jgi:hypothetical protein
MGLDRSFLAMLNMPVVITPFLNEDAFGNTVYGAPFNTSVALDPKASAFGTENNERQEGTTVNSTSFISDALGIKLRDRVTLPDGTLVYVTAAETAYDEDGSDLYQTITAESTERG